MKKYLKRLTIASILCLTSLSVLSCKNSNSQESIKSDVLFSELFHGTTLDDLALEVASKADNTCLDGYSIEFYRYDKLNYTYTFKDITLNKDEVVILYNKDFTYKEDIKNFKTIALDDNYINNHFHTRLIDNKGRHIDSLNHERISSEMTKNCSMIRLKEYFSNRVTYRPLDFIRVKNDTRKYLGNVEAPMTLEEILTGPRLDEEKYGGKPFVEKGYATGGYTKVTLAKNGLGDGDTTQFDFPAGQGIENGYEHRCRYLFIDTPEVYHGPGRPDEPYGQKAKKYNNDRLKNATGYICQSNKNKSITGNYGRTLAFVWYASVKDPKLEDYRLLNFEMLVQGLANYDGRDPNYEMDYKGIMYNEYMNYAVKYAEENEINLYGGPDPDFNYDNN